MGWMRRRSVIVAFGIGLAGLFEPTIGSAQDLVDVPTARVAGPTLMPTGTILQGSRVAGRTSRGGILDAWRARWRGEHPNVDAELQPSSIAPTVEGASVMAPAPRGMGPAPSVVAPGVTGTRPARASALLPNIPSRQGTGVQPATLQIPTLPPPATTTVPANMPRPGSAVPGVSAANAAPVTMPRAATTSHPRTTPTSTAAPMPSFKEPYRSAPLPTLRGQAIKARSAQAPNLATQARRTVVPVEVHRGASTNVAAPAQRSAEGDPRPTRRTLVPLAGAPVPRRTPVSPVAKAQTLPTRPSAEAVPMPRLTPSEASAPPRRITPTSAVVTPELPPRQTAAAVSQAKPQSQPTAPTIPRAKAVSSAKPKSDTQILTARPKVDTQVLPAPPAPMPQVQKPDLPVSTGATRKVETKTVEKVDTQVSEAKSKKVDTQVSSPLKAATPKAGSAMPPSVPLPAPRPLKLECVSAVPVPRAAPKPALAARTEPVVQAIATDRSASEVQQVRALVPAIEEAAPKVGEKATTVPTRLPTALAPPAQPAIQPTNSGLQFLSQRAAGSFLIDNSSVAKPMNVPLAPTPSVQEAIRGNEGAMRPGTRSNAEGKPQPINSTANARPRPPAPSAARVDAIPQAMAPATKPLSSMPTRSQAAATAPTASRIPTAAPAISAKKVSLPTPERAPLEMDGRTTSQAGLVTSEPEALLASESGTVPAVRSRAALLSPLDRVLDPQTGKPLQAAETAMETPQVLDPMEWTRILQVLKHGTVDADRAKAVERLARTTGWQTHPEAAATLRHIILTDFDTRLRAQSMQLLATIHHEPRLVASTLRMSAEFDGDAENRALALRLLQHLAAGTLANQR